MDKETMQKDESQLEQAAVETELEAEAETEALTEEDAPEEAGQALTETGAGEALADDGDDEDDDEEDEDEYEYEDEEPAPLAVTTKTEIDDLLLDFIIMVQMRQAKKSTRRNLLIGIIASATVATVCLLNQQDVVGFILWVVTLLLFQSYWNSSERSARKRLARSKGQVWAYTFAEDGIHVGPSLSDACIAWSTVAKAWLEEGYYVLEVKNSDVVVKAANLTESERNTVELLMLEHVSDCRL
ncbi:MAG: hypothetical protein LUC48_05890 [Clostridiales bacterium]|nr:hypothetical protein [Clostridiales bacterium]